MKSAQVLRLEALTTLIRHREDLTDEQLLDLLRSMLGCGRSPAAHRAKRYRDARAARERDSSVTNVTPTVTPKRDERHAATPRPSVPPTPPSDSLTPSDPKESAVASEGSDRLPAGEQQAAAAESFVRILKREVEGATRQAEEAEAHALSLLAKGPRDWSKQPPTNIEDALEMPLQQRAELVQRDAFRAQWVEPHRWPEVRMACVAYREAVKKPKLAVGSFSTDLGVRRLVELYAAGLTADEICAAIPLVVASAWWTSGDTPRDLGSLSLTVVRRALAERKPPPAAELDALPRPMFGGGS